MADFAARKINPGFTGLISTSIIFFVIGGVCLVGFETLRQLKRLPRLHFRSFRNQLKPSSHHGRRKRRHKGTNDGGGSASDGFGEGTDCERPLYKHGLGTTPEDWEMGHLYMARQFHASTPSPPPARYPFMWALQALRFKDWFYATHTGMDTVVYVRFLRACVWWLTLHTLTTAPILLTIHLEFSKGVELTDMSHASDMSRASLSYLVLRPQPDGQCPREANEKGRKLLWIHLCIMWYITLTWAYAMYWLGRGSVLIRRRLVERIRERNVLRPKRHAHKKAIAALENGRKKARGKAIVGLAGGGQEGAAGQEGSEAKLIDGLPAGHSANEFGGLIHAAAHQSLFFKHETPWRRNKGQKKRGNRQRRYDDPDEFSDGEEDLLSVEDDDEESKEDQIGRETENQERSKQSLHVHAISHPECRAVDDPDSKDPKLLLPTDAVEPLNSSLVRASSANEGGGGAQTIKIASGNGEERPHQQRKNSSKKRKPKFDPSSAGWRQRTVIVTNMPSTMRDEASVRRYFEEFLRPDVDEENDGDEGRGSMLGEGRQEAGERMSELVARQEETRLFSQERDGSRAQVPGSLEMKDAKDIGTLRAADIKGYSHLRDEGDNDGDEYQDGEPWRGDSSTCSATAGEGKDAVTTAGADTITAPPAIGPEPDVHKSFRHRQSPVQTVVLVRKMVELSSMLQRRQEVLQQLEAAHIKLAQNVIGAIGRQTIANRRRDAKEARKERKRKRKRKVQQHGHAEDKMADLELGDSKTRTSSSPDKRAGAGEGLKADVKNWNEQEALEELTCRLARFVPCNTTGAARRKPSETIWEALADVPRELLDPLQPVTRLSALFRGQTVPTIDYLLTKLNLLTALVTEMRSRPPSSYEPTSTAFVTFRDPRQARMVWRELDSQIIIKVRMAPEVKDLDWERLMRTSFTGDLVRGAGVNAFFWAFTIFWVLLIQSIVQFLFSVPNLKMVFPPLRSIFVRYPGAVAFVSITLPTLFVSVVTMTVPELVFQISKRAQGFVTFSGLYDQCMCRYWKFIICNVVIFFCIGATAIQTILQRFGNPAPGTVLETIACAFPVAAPFFVSYLILCMGTHTGLELFQAIIGLVQHVAARNAFTPRARAAKTLPRNFNRYYWLPFHVLIMTIIFIFTVLNPLVLPFALLYFWIAMVVFKKNFAYVYIRRFNEKEGVFYFVRLLRFSLDGLMTGQVVLTIFFGVTNQRAVYTALTGLLIPLTAVLKILGTRLWKSQVRALEDDEANALCGIDVEPSWQRLRRSIRKDYADSEAAADDSFDTHSPLDVRASGRYPFINPPPSATTTSSMYRVWQRLHDSFHANGNERPSYIIQQEAKGRSPYNPFRRTARFFVHAPAHIAERTAEKTKALSVAVKTQQELHRKNKEESAREEGDGTNMGDKSAILSRAHAGTQIQFQNVVLRHHSSKMSDEQPMLPVSNNHSRQASDEATATPGFTGYRTEESSVGLVRSRSARSQVVLDMAPREPTIEEGVEGAALAQEEKRRPSTSPRSQNSHGTNDAVKCEAIAYPHPKLMWEDHPNNLARYNNPYYNAVLDPFLWLPKEPSKVLDLCNTIEWYGAALVSSQGGKGNVGEWENSEDEDGKDEYDFDSLSLANLDGDEVIAVPESLARRLENVEEADEVFDPATSLPKAVMEDYKRAIRRTSNGGSEDGNSMRMPSLLRATSWRSDARSVVSLSSQPGSPVTVRMVSTPEQACSANRRPTLDSFASLHLGEAKAPGELSSAASEQISEVPVPLSAMTYPGMKIAQPDGIIADTAASERRAANVSGHGHLAFVDSPHKGHPSSRLYATSHSRRATGASYMSHGTAMSGVSSAGGRSITMKKALQAEVLEEERRETIGRNLMTRQKNAQRRRKLKDEEAASHDAAEVPTSAIMAKHEQAVRRREASIAQSVVDGSNAATEPPYTPSHRPSVSQWGVVSLSNVLASWTGASQKAAEVSNQSQTDAAEMDELPSSSARRSSK
ncbi:hypothetical protein K437DRAFT_274687 [Tilletiaria anomala UBC 951]|uniref:DUF221-domain-containing protein n=1 Tax=Tilletiaria anomala (strain ATCC 24038 / CBS 436.72 / UBC 951) TaxID=1037660 RepID=A0A066VQP3_TILAU|nr:uncharacterized protein K437DRAFT_274687 [Tilletiaria anomala UBC 951]KDN44067.1 hypothetical protein K437DRAFT_274687 [Tilletiaria anomala UBC 951]